MKLELRPITQRASFAFIECHHRHHKAPRGHLFALACYDDNLLVGVVVVGRPVARMLDDGLTAEVLRLCTIPDAPMGAASKLYSAAKRAAQALAYRRVITYILSSEEGMSLRAAGWICRGLTSGGSWSRPSRERTDRHPLEAKTLWEAA